MNKRLTFGAFALIFAFSSLPVFAEGAPLSCSLATLRGTYAGDGIHPKNGNIVASVFVESYDGQGHLTFYQQFSTGTSHVTYSGKGTYTVGTLTDASSGTPITENCVAFVHYEGDPTEEVWNFFLAPDGSSFYFVNTFDTGSIAAGHEQRISLGQLVR